MKLFNNSSSLLSLFFSPCFLFSTVVSTSHDGDAELSFFGACLSLNSVHDLRAHNDMESEPWFTLLSNIIIIIAIIVIMFFIVNYDIIVNPL